MGALFILSVQPIIVIRRLILTVLIYSIYILWIIRSFWFRYIFVLVIMRGVLVVFTYIISVLPNERFELSSLVLVVLGLVILYKYSKFEEFIREGGQGAIQIWWGVIIFVRIFLVIYLLVVIIIVVWIRILEKGAIRIS